MVHNFPATWKAEKPNKALCVLTLTDTQAVLMGGNGSQLFCQSYLMEEKGIPGPWPHGGYHTIILGDWGVQ